MMLIGVETHSQQVSDGALVLHNEGAAVPEGQAVGQVDDQDGDTQS